MKKIVYGICLMLAVSFVNNVYAEDHWLGSIVRGESFLVENYDEGVCENGSGFVAFEVDGKCLITNNLGASTTTDLNLTVYTDPTSGDESYLELSAEEVSHQSGRVIPYELTYIINNQNSVARKFFVDDMKSLYTGDWSIYAGYKGDKIYILVMDEFDTFVISYNYNTSTRVMSYNFNNVDATPEQNVAASISHYMFLFLVEADPNFATEAKAIMQDTSKLAYVDVADVFDDGTSNWEYSVNDYLSSFDFAMLLVDNKATAFVDSYNTYFASGEKPVFSFVNEPSLPEDPDPLPANPPADPTEPTQPTQPVPSPNTGVYVSVIGIAVMAFVAVILLAKKKNKFNRI